MNGSTTQRAASSPPMTTITTVATAKPSAVPSTAWNPVTPVPSAFDRSTLSVPSTTQKAWSRSKALAIPTAAARPSRGADRGLRKRTDRGSR